MQILISDDETVSGEDDDIQIIRSKSPPTGLCDSIENDKRSVSSDSDNQHRPIVSENADSDVVSSRIGKPWTAADMQTLKELKRKGKSDEEIATEMRRNVSGVKKKWERHEKYVNQSNRLKLHFRMYFLYPSMSLQYPSTHSFPFVVPLIEIINAKFVYFVH